MPMLEALVCEVHSAALLTATIASAINAFRRNGAVRSEAGLKPYVPGEPAIVSVLRNGMLETDLNEDTVRLVIQFFDDLAPARIALDRYFADANHIGEDRAATLHLLTVSNTWRRACQDALLAVRQLHADLTRLPAQYASNSKLLNNLLQDAIIGGSPCLDAEGQIAVPDLPQRRAVGAPHRVPAVHAHPQSGDLAGLRARRIAGRLRPRARPAAAFPSRRSRSRCRVDGVSPASSPGAAALPPVCGSRARCCPTTRC